MTNLSGHQIKNLVKDFIDLGVRPGVIVMLHASVKVIGWVVGAPDVVLDALRERVSGTEGTLMMLIGWEAITPTTWTRGRKKGGGRTWTSAPHSTRPLPERTANGPFSRSISRTTHGVLPHCQPREVDGGGRGESRVADGVSPARSWVRAEFAPGEALHLGW